MTTKIIETSDIELAHALKTAARSNETLTVRDIEQKKRAERLAREQDMTVKIDILPTRKPA